MARKKCLIKGQFHVWWPNFGKVKVQQISIKSTVVVLLQPKLSIQNMRKRLQKFPKKSTGRLLQEGAILKSRILKILHDNITSFLTKFKFSRDKLIVIKQYNKGSSIKYVRKIFRKTNFSNPLIRTCTRYLIHGPQVFCWDIIHRSESDPSLFD